MAETVAAIVAAHRAGKMTPAETVARSYARLRAHGDAAMFISAARGSRRDRRSARAEATPSLPLYGVPVAVKDNIDVAGLPTTAACPAFAYQPHRDATAVARLRAAGAIVIGKTNLDQFATGLVGVRSPYGVPRNPFKPELIPGGSSSGSAVAVAAGIVPLALGTDTAGSGRVPAGLNNIVGLKPSLGLVSTYGVVPACRTLDCVSVFALTVDDAWSALAAIAGPDANDPYSRQRPLGDPGAMPAQVKIGVPRAGQRLFFGDQRIRSRLRRRADAARQARLRRSSRSTSSRSTRPRACSTTAPGWPSAPSWPSPCSTSDPNALHPVTREIIVSGLKPTAMDAFAAFYKLEELRRVAERTFDQVDALALPTAPTAYTVAQVLADPIQLNSRLGTYTNFVNLLDLCGLALPAAFTKTACPSASRCWRPAARTPRSPKSAACSMPTPSCRSAR